MQMIITDAWLAKSGTLYLSGRRLLLLLVLSAFVVMLLAVGLYHWVFLKGAREGWPVIGSLVRLVVKDEFEQRDRFVRENLDVMARKLGEMQVKMMQLESLGERVSGLAGVNPAELRAANGLGGVLVSGPALTLPDLQATLDDLESLTHQRTDLFTVIESRLFERKMQSLLIPTQKPVTQGEVGSAFGWRLDPITGRTALHTGLDFRAESGTPILAAAGGVVVTQEFHPEYGNMIEIEHGDDLISRYAHASKTLVKKGDLIKRGQKIAEVGSTGRSTGAHLHFEVMVQGVFQDPQKFLLARQPIKAAQLAQATSGSNLSRARTRSPVRP
ncbi:M23 family metallopeptidase [Rhodoferax sp.]|uniref:M23 family metallopeptidase n=1 Tax=Rhodoferax sp. TaxID=50421 RepID=UPI0008C95FD8|nr:M23 family metallopeptidase [Rhodoferax sp.]MDO8318174.1 M23 family metallopeptidase [Rhodoferax sp.]MDP2677952.1 M23 family metallopeptidase [Rhodoferax sp.]OGB41756.1 MAG: peptidase M23 [Burkholderiales bacterium RIFOXYC2_FULL_59_8]OGB59995.1 MAG: peptidase M23 [Burkholderiales bacterium RIFOXYD12_FULL_59_19]